MAPRAAKRKPPAAEARARGVPPPLFLQPQHSKSATQRHGACAGYRCRIAGAVSTGRACASGGLLKSVAGAARGGSERCCMQRGKQQRSVRGDVRSEMTALWRCLTTTGRRVSCNRTLDGCVSHSSPGAMLDDYLPSSDFLHVCLTTCCGCAVSVTALADVVKRAGGRCLMAR